MCHWGIFGVCWKANQHILPSCFIRQEAFSAAVTTLEGYRVQKTKGTRNSEFVGCFWFTLLLFFFFFYECSTLRSQSSCTISVLKKCMYSTAVLWGYIAFSYNLFAKKSLAGAVMCSRSLQDYATEVLSSPKSLIESIYMRLVWSNHRNVATWS